MNALVVFGLFAFTVAYIIKGLANSADRMELVLVGAAGAAFAIRFVVFPVGEASRAANISITGAALQVLGYLLMCTLGVYKLCHNASGRS